MGNRKNIGVEIGSILIFAAGIFSFFSLATYHSNDIARSLQPQNSCGRVGAYLANHTLNWFGIGSFILPLLLFIAAVAIHKRQRSIQFLITLAGISAAAVSFVVLLSIQWRELTYGGAKLLTGGTLGVWVSNALLHQLNAIGSSIVALVALCLALEICTPLHFTHLCGMALGKLWTGIAGLGIPIFRWVGTGVLNAVGKFLISLQRSVKKGCLQALAFLFLKIRVFYSYLYKKVQIGYRGEGDLGLQPRVDRFQGENSVLGEDQEIALASIVPTRLTPDAMGRPLAISELEPAEESTQPDIQISLPQVKSPQSKVRHTGRIGMIHGNWKLPTVEFLRKPPQIESTVDRNQLIENSLILKQKFADFGIEGEVTAVRPGPVITLYEFRPGPGVKVSRIAALADDLSMALSAQSVRILAPLPGKSVVGIEIPSEVRETVYLREFLQHPDFYGNKLAIPVIMGKDIGGQTYLSDLARMPHLLCAGQTGSGKSVFMNGLICSLFYRFTPDELRMILVDPKFIEFRAYQDIPHLLLPVVDDPKQASIALKWAVREMERRYRILAKIGARNLAAFNQKIEEMGEDVVRDLLFAEETPSLGQDGPGKDWLEAFEPGEDGAPLIKKLPFIVIIIDELADLMMTAKKEVEISIARIAQKARAAGIHLIIATQRPSTDVITGLIKANLPSRVSFQLASYVDSKTILDRAGAERLLGQGDMLFIPPGVSTTLRLHGAFLEDDEIAKITSFLKAQGKPAYRDEILFSDEEEGSNGDGNGDGRENGEDDELFREAMELVKSSGHASASFLQRHFKIGYNRAARIIETMEARGIIGPADGAKPREILIR